MIPGLVVVAFLFGLFVVIRCGIGDRKTRVVVLPPVVRPDVPYCMYVRDSVPWAEVPAQFVSKAIRETIRAASAHMAESGWAKMSSEAPETPAAKPARKKSRRGKQKRRKGRGKK